MALESNPAYISGRLYFDHLHHRYFPFRFYKATKISQVWPPGYTKKRSTHADGSSKVRSPASAHKDDVI